MKNKLIQTFYLILYFSSISCNNQVNELTSSEQGKTDDYDLFIKRSKTVYHKKKSRKLSSFFGNWHKIDGYNLRDMSVNTRINFRNIDDVKQRFARLINLGEETPIGVYFNEYVCGEGQNPNIKHNWSSLYRTKGFLCNEKSKEAYSDFKRIPYSVTRVHKNSSSKDTWLPFPGSSEFDIHNYVHWNITGDIKEEVGGKIEIPLRTELDNSITIDLYSQGFGTGLKSPKHVFIDGTNTLCIPNDNTVIINSNNEIFVPAGKVAYWELVERHKTHSSKWKASIEFKGKIGADYGKKHHEHYFWAIDAEDFFYEYKNKVYVIEVNEQHSKEIKIRCWIADN